jgi:isopropylmalate/homocitrate/citramalate synthase
MPDYTMRDDWICFTHTFADGGELYIEQKLTTTVEEDMQAAIDMMEVLRNVG